MSLCNCSQCGQMMIAGYDKRCRACAQHALQDSRKVKDYVRQHPGASLIEVYQRTGVSLQTIKDLIRT